MELVPKTLRELANENFYNVFTYARIYADYNGSLDISEDFRTDDGFNYKEDGKINLGKWIHKQGKMVDPNSDKGIMLSSIGMIWDFNNNKKRVFDLCRKYQIDIEINYLLINRLAAQTFESKLLYLMDNNINIVNKNSELIDFFYLPDEELKKAYGVTKEDVYKLYFVKETKSKSYVKR